MFAGNRNLQVRQGRTALSCVTVGVSSMVLEFCGYFWIWCLFNFHTFVSSHVNVNFKHEGLERWGRTIWLSLIFRPTVTTQVTLYSPPGSLLSFCTVKVKQHVDPGGWYQKGALVCWLDMRSTPVPGMTLWAACSWSLGRHSRKSLVGRTHGLDCRICCHC